ncbi:aromatic ring hydroxylase [Mesorhizobium shonense]|uniref:Aromatic ring hydroxylase n=1 Tax=Mesorhizobium shonense TaxID=1209948 RepID=A0ABV2HJV6_9HYPH
MIKTGAQHIEMLRDGRQVYVNGQAVGDVTVHPAFRRTIRSVGSLYDFQARPDNRELMTFEVPEGGGRANRIWQLPRSHAELVERRRALEAWTELHYGFLGRAPDHVASCICGMFMGIEVFEAYDKVRAGALSEYYRFARDNELYLTYAILNPQADRSKPASEQQDRFLTAGVVDQDAGGLTIRGAKMLATGGIMANEVLITCIQPLREGDEPYAVSFAVPMNAGGLEILSRKSYEESAVNVFDNPLASRFDENDAVLYFDDVKVPWDRVANRKDAAVAGHLVRGAGKVLQAGLGCGRLGIRLAPHPVRNVLCWRQLRHQGAQLPHLRLGPLHAARRPHAGQLLPG